MQLLTHKHTGRQETGKRQGTHNLGGGCNTNNDNSNNINDVSPPLQSTPWKRRRRLRSASTERPAASAVPAVNDRSEGIPDHWRSCLERSSL